MSEFLLSMCYLGYRIKFLSIYPYSSVSRKRPKAAAKKMSKKNINTINIVEAYLFGSRIQGVEKKKTQNTKHKTGFKIGDTTLFCVSCSVLCLFCLGVK